MKIELYLVGENKEVAREVFPFDSYDTAKSYAEDQTVMPKIYAVKAFIDFSTMEEV